MRAWKSLAASLTAVGTLAGSAVAANVPVGPGDDVQAILNASSPGDRILFAPGTYNTRLMIPHDLRLESAGSDAETIFDGSGLDGAILWSSTEGIALSVKDITFRFNGFDEDAVVIDGASTVLFSGCVFRGADRVGLRSEAEVVELKGLRFRGNGQDVVSRHFAATMRGGKHFQTLGNSVRAVGPLSTRSLQWTGTGGIALTAIGFGGQPSNHGGPVSDLSSLTVRRAREGVMAIGLDTIISGLTAKGVSGQSCGVVGMNCSVVGGSARRTTVGVNVFGVLNSVSGVNIQRATVGVFLIGVGNDASGNKISDTAVGIRVAEQWNVRDDGGQNPDLRVQESDPLIAVVSGNELSNIGGVGIAVEGTRDVEVVGNMLKQLGGRALGSLLNPTVGPGMTDSFAGAIAAFGSEDLLLSGNTIGEVDAGAGISAGRVNYIAVTANRVTETSGSGIVLGDQDPFADGLDAEGYYEYYYGDDYATGLGRTIYGRLNLVTLLLSENSDIYDEYLDEFEYGFDVFDQFRYEYGEYQQNLANHEYYESYGMGNSVESNYLFDVAGARGGGVALFEQDSADVRYNTVLGSGGTGILLVDVDATNVASNSVTGSERDGIWLVSERAASGNAIAGNIVVFSGAEGIQNGADEGYGRTEYYQSGYTGAGYQPTGGYTDYYAYCNSYEYGECVGYAAEYIPGGYEYAYYEYDYNGSYGYLENGTIITGNFVSNSGIADFANDGAVNVDASTGNFPQPADWYAIPPRQY